MIASYEPPTLEEGFKEIWFAGWFKCHLVLQ
jgi:hypothetical protein